jgi:hypothetical protein
MTALLYSILIALNLITSAAEFDQLPVEEQQELLIVNEDVFL